LGGSVLTTVRKRWLASRQWVSQPPTRWQATIDRNGGQQGKACGAPWQSSWTPQRLRIRFLERDLRRAMCWGIVNPSTPSVFLGPALRRHDQLCLPRRAKGLGTDRRHASLATVASPTRGERRPAVATTMARIARISRPADLRSAKPSREAHESNLIPLIWSITQMRKASRFVCEECSHEFHQVPETTSESHLSSKEVAAAFGHVIAAPGAR
jgi:hypothetical protein